MVFHGDLDFILLFIYVCKPQGHKITNASLIMTFVALFFYIWAKHIIGHFSGFFMEISTFFYLHALLQYVMKLVVLKERKQCCKETCFPTICNEAGGVGRKEALLYENMLSY